MKKNKFSGSTKSLVYGLQLICLLAISNPNPFKKIVSRELLVLPTNLN